MNTTNDKLLGGVLAMTLLASGVANTADSLHEATLVLDTHLDTPTKLEYRTFSILDRHDPVADMSSVDLPRMVEGGLDGGFWVIFTSQGPLTGEGYAAARDEALLRAVAVREMVTANSQHFALALNHDDAMPIAAAGKRIVYQSIENAYPFGEDLSLVQTFYSLGVRMLGLVHTSNNQFADSSTDKMGLKWNGVSPLGRELIDEANRLGIVLDASHAHDIVLEQMIELSATPIILSHSGAKDVYAHARNVPDELLRKLADSGGVIQMNALGSYLKDIKMPPERRAAMAALRKQYGPVRDFDEQTELAYLAARSELASKYAAPKANFEDYMAHFLHALELVGPEHVGVGADWDGGGGVIGLEDVSKLPRITERLLAEGYSEEDIAKIWGGNVLRLLKAAEQHAAQLRR